MNVTEKEAAEKWCPQINEGRNRLGEVEEEVSVFSATRHKPTCIGARCMAWHWTSEQPHRKSHLCANLTATTEPPRPAGIPDSWVFTPYDSTDSDSAADWAETQEEANSRRKGYCGLAR